MGDRLPEDDELAVRPAKPGLPPIQRADAQQSAIDQSRSCAQCGQPARIESSSEGVQGFCGPCGLNWPIANASAFWNPPLSLPRGLQKRTLVEPDYSLAFEDDPDIGSQ